MSIHVVTEEECANEQTNIQFAYQAFMAELEFINQERGLLLQEATHALEEAAADKLRQQIRDQHG